MSALAVLGPGTDKESPLRARVAAAIPPPAGAPPPGEHHLRDGLLGDGRPGRPYRVPGLHRPDEPAPRPRGVRQQQAPVRRAPLPQLGAGLLPARAPVSRPADPDGPRHSGERRGVAALHVRQHPCLRPPVSEEGSTTSRTSWWRWIRVRRNRSAGSRSAPRSRSCPTPSGRSGSFPPNRSAARGGRCWASTAADRSSWGSDRCSPGRAFTISAKWPARFPDVDFIWVGGRPFGLVSAGLQELNHLMATTPANLHFAGLHDLTVMPQLYNAADVMLFPSRQENCPYAPIEAAACGLPVIFRNLPVYAGLYRTGYCAADDAAGFIALLRSLLADPGEYRRAQQLLPGPRGQLPGERLHCQHRRAVRQGGHRRGRPAARRLTPRGRRARTCLATLHPSP